MNCDDAFERLTDPACRDAAELQWHLDRCPRCRQMQEVLAPALDLFDAPADAFAESQSMPSSGSGFLSAESILLAERTAADLSRSPIRQTPPRRSGMMAIVKYAAVFLLGAAAVFGITTGGADRDPDFSAPLTECLWTKQTPAEQKERAANSKRVVLSCVECHLSSTGR